MVNLTQPAVLCFENRFSIFRLMVNLTQPAVLCFENKIPDDKTGQHYYLDIVTQLQAYKEV